MPARWRRSRHLLPAPRRPCSALKSPDGPRAPARTGWYAWEWHHFTAIAPPMQLTRRMTSLWPGFVQAIHVFGIAQRLDRAKVSVAGAPFVKHHVGIDEAHAALADGVLAAGDRRIAALDHGILMQRVAAPFLGLGGRERGDEQTGGDDAVAHFGSPVRRPNRIHKA